jgi:hypothetical protein
MARPKKSNSENVSADILEFLTPERRRAVLDEAVGSKVRDLFGRHQSATLGELVSALTGDSHWGLLREVSISSVIGGATRGAGKNGKKLGRRGRLDEGTLGQILKTVEKHPGLRSEQIQKQLDVDPRLVKAGLARLRAEKRVKTTGERRATTYAVA